MTSPRTRRRALWSVPLVTTAVVAGLAAWPTAASADAHPKLAARTPAQLLADVQTSSVEHFSGTVVETARLGVPALPGADSASLTWQTLVTGSHTVRVWVDGPEHQRVALLAQLSESDVVHNGNDLWTYASDRQTVGHTSLTGKDAKATSDKSSATSKDLAKQTPAGIADELLKAISPSTHVTVDRTQRVAGRAAYTLVLSPKDSRSTVRKVAIAIDAQRHMPLRVQVFGGAKRPAIDVGFSDISFARPSAATFAFKPPAGAKVSNDLFPLMSAAPSAKPETPSATKPTTKTVGTGWTSVLVVKGAGDSLAGAGGPQSSQISHLFVRQADGSRLLQTALVNVLIAPNGTVAVGAVQPSLLRSAIVG